MIKYFIDAVEFFSLILVLLFAVYIVVRIVSLAIIKSIDQSKTIIRRRVFHEEEPKERKEVGKSKS